MKNIKSIFVAFAIFLGGILLTDSCQKVDMTGTLIVKNVDTRFELPVAVYPYNSNPNLGKPLYQDTLKEGQESATYVLNPDNYIVYGGVQSKVVQIHAGETIELKFDNH